MSLVQRVTSRNQIDLLNEGLSYSATGSTGGAVTDMVIVPISAERAPIITGFTLSSSGGPFLVTLGFKRGAEATLVFFQGIVSSTTPISVYYNQFAWYRGDLAYQVVITAAGDVSYSVDSKITSFPAALGYVEHEGGQSPSGHLGRAMLPPQSGFDRGQSEL